MRAIKFAMCLGAMVWSGSVAAHDPARDVAVDLSKLDINKSLRRQILRDTDQFIESSVMSLFAQSPNGVLSAKTIELNHVRALKQRRRSHLSKVLQYDLDDDGEVSAAEAEAQLEQLVGQQKGRLVALRLIADLNGDGALSAQEITAYVDKKNPSQPKRQLRTHRLLAFDLNEDGAVDAAEIVRVVRAIIAQDQQAKLDSASKVRPPKRTDGSSVPKAPQATSSKLAICEYPDVPKGAKVVLIGTKAGATLSNVALEDREEVTTVVELHISKGEAPLYLIAGSKTRVIWKLTGETTRVHRFVSGALNGVVGLNGAARFLNDYKNGCLPQRRRDAAKGSAFAKDVAWDLGIKETEAVAAHLMGRITVPEGREQMDFETLRQQQIPVMRNREQQFKGAEGYRPATAKEKVLWRLANLRRRQHPGGVAQLEAGKVLAPVRKMSYGKILPMAAGLIQLIERGDIEVRENGQMVIVRALPGMPAGLGNTRIHIAPGVPMPRKEPPAVRILPEVPDHCIESEVCPKP